MDNQKLAETNGRHSIVICSHMEVPLIQWDNTYDLIDTIRFFQRKTFGLRPNSLRRREFCLILDILHTAQEMRAKLETIYQKDYELFIVLSFDNLELSERFECSIPSELVFRYAFTVDVPMNYQLPFQRPASLTLAKSRLEISKKFTTNLASKRHLTEAKDLLNFVSSNFNNAQIEAMYRENSRLFLVLSFETLTDRDNFLYSAVTPSV